MGINKLFNFKKNIPKKIDINKSELVLKKEQETEIFIDGKAYKKIQFRIIDELDIDVAFGVHCLENSIKELQEKICSLKDELLFVLQNKIYYQSLFINFYNIHLQEQKIYTALHREQLVKIANYKDEVKKLLAENKKVQAAEKLSIAAMKFQTENNILKQQILGQDKIIKSYQKTMLDDAQNLKQAEKLIEILKKRIENLK